MDDKIQRQIEDVAVKRFFLYMLRIAAMLLAVGLILRLLAGLVPDRATRAILAFAAGGCVFGQASLFLASVPRRWISLVFLCIPPVVFLAMFTKWALFGGYETTPLGFVLTPLAFSAGFFAGRIKQLFKG